MNTKTTIQRISVITALALSVSSALAQQQAQQKFGWGVAVEQDNLTVSNTTQNGSGITTITANNNGDKSNLRGRVEVISNPPPPS